MVQEGKESHGCGASDIETTTTTTICEERRAGHGRCPTWFRLLLRSSPPSPTCLLALFFFFPLFAALAPSRHMRKQLLVHHPRRVARANAPRKRADPRASSHSDSNCSIGRGPSARWGIGGFFFLVRLWIMFEGICKRFICWIFWTIFFWKKEIYSCSIDLRRNVNLRKYGMFNTRSFNCSNKCGL